MTKLLVLLSALVFQFPSMAQASEEQFLDYLKRHASITPANFEINEVYGSFSKSGSVDERLYQRLLSIADSQAQVWGDTILEGDVAALGEIRLDTIEELRDGSQLLGFRITYSQRAWATGDCDLSEVDSEGYARPETFAQCAEGRIFESAYVLADLKTHFADYDAVAELEVD